MIVNKNARKPDFWVVLIYLVLVIFGWMNIYSTESNLNESMWSFAHKHGTQLMWIIISFISAAVVMIVSVRFYSVFSYFIYVAVIFLLVMVLVVGIEVNGSKSWLAIGSLRLQPAELAKMATALALARFMDKYDFKLNTASSWAGILFFIGLPIILILLQKDWGSAIVFTSFFIMLYREGMSGWILALGFFLIFLFITSLLVAPVWIVCMVFIVCAILTMISDKDREIRLGFYSIAIGILIAAGIYMMVPEDRWDTPFIYKLGLITCSLLILAHYIYSYVKYKKNYIYIVAFFFVSIGASYSVDYVFDNVLKTHHRDRIEDMLGTKVDLRGAGYNVHQSKVAIGSGGLVGKGYLNGTQTKLNFVPEQSTDFIFCTIGEEWGFVGTFLTVILYVTLLLRLIVLTENQKNKFARVYGYCVVSIFFFHFLINIAMTIGLAPVVGIPLPFISAGGSSLWSFTILLFIFLKFNATREQAD